MKKDDYEVKASADENDCPADRLMADFRKKVRSGNKKVYARHFDISEKSISFWRNHADIIEENADNITFYWEEIEEEDLPPLKIKIRKVKGEYLLSYLREYGEDKLLIRGKQRKGKNRSGKLFLNKEEKEGEDR